MRFYDKTLNDKTLHGTDKWRDMYNTRYELMRASMKPAPPELVAKLKAKCEESIFISDEALREDCLCEEDYEFTLTQINTLDKLEMFFDHGNWSIRQGVVYKDLAFINQVNGGDEWWTLKQDGEEWVAFESCTMRPIIHRGEFRKMIRDMRKSTMEQCESLDYAT
jgi:hypothetical protein